MVFMIFKVDDSTIKKLPSVRKIFHVCPKKEKNFAKLLIP